MNTDRHRAIVAACERFAVAARKAEEEGNHARAAVLSRAALMVLDGHSLDEVELFLEDLFESGAAVAARTRMPLADELPQAHAPSSAREQLGG
jgi:hypothetical protein